MLVLVKRKTGINARDEVKPAPLQKAAYQINRDIILRNGIWTSI